MRIMAVVGSPRARGNTAALVEKVVAGYLEVTGGTAETIHVTEKKIGYCTGCLTCTFPPPGTGTCVLQDDMADILDRMVECDAFVFGTPNHMRTVSAPLLNFLARMLPLFQFLPDTDAQGRIIGGGFTSKLKDRKAAVVISQGDAVFSSSFVHGVLERNLIDMGIRRAGDLVSRGNMGHGDAAGRPGEMEQALQLGRTLATTSGVY